MRRDSFADPDAWPIWARRPSSASNKTMCELLGLSASAPVDVNLSFGRLARHGGPSGQPDGWGIAFLDDTDAEVWRDPHAAATSPWAHHLAHKSISSQTVVAHIRKATLGAVKLANTQPFLRELFGRVHVFAHNGMLREIAPVARTARFRPLGETDSEAAFCHMMADLAEAGDDVAAGRRTFADWAGRLRRLGHANLIYASADRLLVHSDVRITGPGSEPAPGLWMLRRHCHMPHMPAGAEDPLAVASAGLDVVMVASVPLTREAWKPIPRGMVLEIAAGAVVNETALG